MLGWFNELYTFLIGDFRYYELGPDDPPYAAKFYDCCGAEDPDTTGCTTAYHVSYDDDDWYGILMSLRNMKACVCVDTCVSF